MASGNKKKRKNNRNNKKNKIKRAEQPENSAHEEEAEEDQNASMDDELDQQGSKRDHPVDSDNEDEPKRKKKKKQLIPAEPGKGNKSIRQMKREKHAQRQAEEATASKDQLKSQCISYLSQWKHDRQNWKFMKIKQGWLYKNKFSSYLLPDSSWPVLLEYFESAKGNIRNLLLEDASKVIKDMDEWTESQNTISNISKSKDDNETCEQDQNKDKEGPKKPDDTAYKRARDLIQCLQE